MRCETRAVSLLSLGGMVGASSTDHPAGYVSRHITRCSLRLLPKIDFGHSAAARAFSW